MYFADKTFYFSTIEQFEIIFEHDLDRQPLKTLEKIKKAGLADVFLKYATYELERIFDINDFLFDTEEALAELQHYATSLEETEENKRGC